MYESFVKKDFDELKKMKLYGRLCEGVDAELYWFNCIDREDAAFSQTIKKHHHDFFEVHFVLSGTMVYSFDSSVEKAEAQSVLIIPAGVPHTVESYSSDMLKASITVKIGESEPLYKGLYEKGCRAIKLDGEITEGISYCTKTAGKSIPYKEKLVKNRIFELLSAIVGEFDFTEQRKSEYNGDGEPDIRLFKVKQFIKDNESLFPSCEELAQYCNVSAKQLNRIFIKYEGMPLLKYLHNEKISQMKKSLLEGNLSMKEISDGLGFSSVYYFCKFFTSHAGVSPGVYRKTEKESKQ